MKYHGKLYGKLWDKYFDTSHTTDEWDAMEKRIAELEKENQVLRKPEFSGRSEQLVCPECKSSARLLSEKLLQKK